MIKLPIDYLIHLLSLIECEYGSSFELIHIGLDDALSLVDIHSPLGYCIIELDENSTPYLTLNYKYAIYLIDFYSLSVIGKSIPFSSMSKVPFFTPDGKGIKGLHDHNYISELLYLKYFVHEFEYKYAPCVSMYELWALNFIATREVLLSLNDTLNSPLISSALPSNISSDLYKSKTQLVDSLLSLLSNYLRWKKD